VESVTLAVYRDQTGGAALWQEVQNVAVDADGHYSLLMGATQNEGMDAVKIHVDVARLQNAQKARATFATRRTQCFLALLE
jgi:hypothetical protein